MQSSVQGLLSEGQTKAVPPVQTPVLQTSAVVQALPSLHAVLLATLVCRQPLTLSQLSVVQLLLSSQLMTAPLLHRPVLQVSPEVQALPSSQEPPSARAACMQPLTLSQLSVVHALASLQFKAPPGLHNPPAQVSPVVQALPSLHAAVLLLWVQPSLASQASFVHGLLSSQLTTDPLQVPVVQTSLAVQAVPSSQPVPSLTLLWVQPAMLSQASVVQAFPSLQLAALPG